MNGLATILVIAIGGALGSLVRHGAEIGAPTVGVEPWVAILAVNIVGCGLMGILFVWLEVRLRRDGTSRLHVHPMRHRLVGHRGVIEEDPTLPAAELARFDQRLRLESGLVHTGLLGGLTTFSSFGLDVVTLIDHGAIGLAVVDVGGSVVVGVAAVLVGLRVGIGMFGKVA